VQLSEVLDSLTIRAGDKVVYSGRAIVNNLVNTGLLLIVSAALTDQWVEPEAQIETDEEFYRATEDFVARWQESQNLLEGYRVAVDDLRNFFVDLNQWLEHARLNKEGAKAPWLASCEQLIKRARPLYEQFSELHARFEGEAGKVPPDSLSVHKSYFQKELHPLVMRAPFLHRTYTKPLGYAGDYEMMNMIHREATEGSTAYAKIINTAYVRLPIAVCVINRAAMLQSYLDNVAAEQWEDPEIRVLCVGCGPAIEIERFVSSNPASERVKFFLMDFNKETLEYAESRIKGAAERARRDVSACFLHRSVHSLLKGSASPLRDEFASRFHFVYCAGLFDYLSDRVCARLVRLFFDLIVPSGYVLVTNMHIRKSSRYVLEHLADWYLIYRDEDAMSQLIPGLGRQRIFSDATGINVCLEVRKVDTAAEH
jgi:extracellular factor (EF) 3-hydroxypalmitic acid methyl ester biosynthesis protein